MHYKHSQLDKRTNETDNDNQVQEVSTSNISCLPLMIICLITECGTQIFRCVHCGKVKCNLVLCQCLLMCHKDQFRSGAQSSAICHPFLETAWKHFCAVDI